MCKSSLALGVFIGAFLWAPLADSQTNQTQNIPDFSGSWDRIGQHVEMYEEIPGYGGPGPLMADPRHPGGTVPGHRLPQVTSLDNPILKPATLARLQAITDAELQDIPHIKDEGMCRPTGIPMEWNRTHAALRILQTPTQVTIINARDHQFRTIYLNVPHSNDPGHTWHGESVGHYEGGDTLVVVTIGQNDKTQVDRYGTPHSEKIHVVERIRVSPDRQSLDVEVNVADPIAFNMPWSALARHTSRFIEWEEEICAENNRYVGQVTIDGVITEDVPTPTDDTPDF
jgi:hypothetical protein